MFFFYAVPSAPFLVLAVTMTLGMIIGPATAEQSRRTVGTVVAALYVTGVALCFMYFYPIYVGETLSYDAWHARMWLGQLWI
jgi:dolichyl-phosphate-mannose--protein O-mannosyl transferase